MNNFYKGGRGLAFVWRDGIIPLRNKNIHKKNIDATLWEKQASIYTKKFLNLLKRFARLFAGSIDQTTKTKSMPSVWALICFMLFNLSTAWAQSAETRTAEGQTEIKPLQIGDTVPNVPLKILNSERNLVQDRLHNYGGEKWIILEFWNTVCAPCIAAMPHLFSLENDVDEKVRVIPVGHESEERMNAFLRNTRAPGMKSLEGRFHTVIEDSVLTAMFPKTSSPHTVILDENYVVRAVTKPAYVDVHMLTELMSSNAPSTSVKLFALEEKLLLAPNELLVNPFYSGLVKYVDGLTTSFESKTDSLNGVVHEFFGNMTLLQLYAAGATKDKPLKGLQFKPEHRILLVKDPHNIVYHTEDASDIQRKLAWDRVNKYSYESVLPITMSTESRRARLRNDMDSFLGMSAELKSVTVPCLVLKQIRNVTRRNLDHDDEKLFVVNGWVPNRLKEQEKYVGNSPSGAQTYIRNLGFKELTTVIRKLSSDPIPTIVDKTGYNGFYNVDFSKESNSLADIRAALQKEGFDLVAGEVEQEMFVLSEDGIEANVDELVFTPLGYVTKSCVDLNRAQKQK
ncbi:TlpA family protein disulfide reductase [Sphingobacterium corticibacterium]|uniref:Redoxin domain-containing protein n=1 Tax=Sphingobacterium corticibacterium TaxID=2484746 RepID=A0A4Q6XMS1_9SPHI|nr:redoxin domain-containing protein [Sphingobacterium corticibacterium]RZF61470.1 redoxin domain-containing protein [Sphingobacterium corticibacterium]